MTPDDGRAIADLYESDFYAWTREQARMLRAGRSDKIDADNLAEEVDTLGRSERRACESFVRLILEHFLKIEYLDQADVVRHHKAEITVFRLELEDELSPSLRREVPLRTDQNYQYVRKRMQLVLDAEGKRASFPQTCPYTWEQIVDDDWFPIPSAKT